MPRKPTLSHLLRAMNAGDVIYLPETAALTDMQVQSVVHRGNGRATTTRFIAVSSDPQDAHRIVRITMVEPMEGKVRVRKKNQLVAASSIRSSGFALRAT